MAAVSAPYGGYSRSVPGSLQPVVDCGANFAPLHGHVAGAGMAGDQQYDSFTSGDCALQAAIDGPPGAVEAVAMEVDDAIGFDRAGAQAPVPAGIEGVGGDVRSRAPSLRTVFLAKRSGLFGAALQRLYRLRRGRGRRGADRLSGKRPYGPRYALPECFFVSAEDRHWPFGRSRAVPCLWE